MRTQACVPCAKRKVRCDKEEPCCNCKRRKKDHCTYPTVSPQDRVKELEAIVRRLGADPESPNLVKQVQTPSSIADSSVQNGVRENSVPREGTLVPLAERAPPVYMENHEWQNCFEGPSSRIEKPTERNEMSSRNMTVTQGNTNAFESLWAARDTYDLAAKHPSNTHAAFLWQTFKERIKPIITISFQWELDQIQQKAKQAEFREMFTDAEHAYIFATYLITTHSLSEQECSLHLHHPKHALTAEYQLLCENALARTNLFCITDIMAISALTIYMIAGLDRLSTSSLWSLMGLVVRNAEKIGLHRDGSLLNISPLETEQRRRLWWQLQNLDLILAVRSGMTSLTLSADWDAKLPLNIEDDDINPDMTDPPTERKGLTSMSYCLFCYWMINEQRKIFRAEPQQSNKTILRPLSSDVVDRLEEGINRTFLQYCDIIKPMDTLVQITSRSLIALFRLQNLLLAKPDQPNDEHHEKIMQASTRCLEYNLAYHSHPHMLPFQWMFQAFFPWHAFMGVLVEISKQNAIEKQQQSWDLLARFYRANPNMFDLKSDKRRVHAAELIISAWKACKNKFQDDETFTKPEFVSQLESKLSILHAAETEGHEPAITDGSAVEDALGTFDLDFQDIDWEFWSTLAE